MSTDPRRSDKIQRYAPKNSANGEDLTPDYMNIMGQPPTTANAAGEPVEKLPDVIDANHQVQPVNDELTATSNAANVIPTSPQYGVAIIPNNASAVTNSEMVVDAAEVVGGSDSLAVKTTGDDIKDIHSTPSRNDRFKVVKIASLEPFKRGRWKCMDYVDEAPPPNVANKGGLQSVGVGGGGAAVPASVYLQTQSLPPQQIQQMLIQGGFANGQFFSGVPAQLIPPGQYFYPQVTNVQNQPVQQQQQQPVATSMPAHFINNQPYFSTGVVTNPTGFTLQQSYPLQYVPIPAQNSAFVPTSQAVHLPANFQQSQTYAGQPTVSQANVNQNMVNGHAFPPQQTEAQVPGGTTMPNQATKNVIVNAAAVGNPQPQNHVVQNPSATPTGVVTIPLQYPPPQGAGTYQAPPQTVTNPAGQTAGAAPSVQMPPPQGVQTFDASSVYTNPQFAMNVNSLTVLEPTDTSQEAAETGSTTETVSENPDDPAKSNPVVNAIDNKIEQAMDLVKSHLMYTVREEVEVLKEKIAELMEKIQQLETENNYLRSQIPKGQTVNLPSAQPNQSSNIAVVNTSPSVMPQNSNPVVNNVPSTAPTPSQNQTIPPNKETSASIQ
ncbi:uncharacterized protein LOC143201348 isoform X1 [Rhynchophorus ferrugineus]|uniref:uncharacterized protein LOC143201348 isoform X1 n=1 Tax=Rhynchophorus ferrugineus TaxID=354439 RepID=UPI003FCDD856